MNVMGDRPATADEQIDDRRYPAGPAHLPERTVFRDARLEAGWRRDGYVVIDDAFDPSRIEVLKQSVADLYVGRDEGFHSTLQSSDVAYRQTIFDVIPPHFAQLAARLFFDYEPFAASLTVKWPGESSELGCHQDWSMVDEFHYRTLNIWCPLVDTTEDNGALRVLSGSHLLLDHLRCSPMNPQTFVSEGTDLPVEELLAVPLSLGQAVVFDLGVLHGSGPNLTESWRPAITVAFKPREAPLLHHYLPSPDADVAEVYEVDARFYTEFTIGERPQRPMARTREFYGTERRRSDLVPTDEPPTFEQRSGPAPAPVFRDPDVEREFTERGFVVMDLLDEGQVDALRALPGEIFHGEPHGMHASNMCNDHEYRHEVYRRVRHILEDVVCAELVDYEACMAIMLLKFPDPDSAFVPHQDWNLTDETRFRTLNVWCPMVDTDTENGAMSFIPGSHRHLRSVRCDPWFPESHQPPGWDVGYKDMETVEVRAGQAVFFDHAMVHASAPNRSGVPRPAVALVVKPIAAPLLHWYRPDPASDELELFSIDSDFLADFEIGDRPNYPVLDTTDFVPDPFDTAELLQRCGPAFRPPRPEPGRSASTGTPPPETPADPPVHVPAPATVSTHAGRATRLVRSLRARAATRFGRSKGARS